MIVGLSSSSVDVELDVVGADPNWLPEAGTRGRRCHVANQVQIVLLSCNQLIGGHHEHHLLAV